MAFEKNFTTSVYATNDAVFRAVKIDGEEYRVADQLPVSGELQLRISHEAKKRERHLAKMDHLIPPTATSPDARNSIHIVVDQGLSPNSNDADMLIMGPAFLRWCADNLPAILRGES